MAETVAKLENVRYSFVQGVFQTCTAGPSMCWGIFYVTIDAKSYSVSGTAPFT